MCTPQLVLFFHFYTGRWSNVTSSCGLYLLKVTQFFFLVSFQTQKNNQKKKTYNRRGQSYFFLRRTYVNMMAWCHFRWPTAGHPAESRIPFIIYQLIFFTTSINSSSFQHQSTHLLFNINIDSKHVNTHPFFPYQLC